jgi:hypothetical protein
MHRVDTSAGAIHSTAELDAGELWCAMHSWGRMYTYGDQTALKFHECLMRLNYVHRAHGAWLEEEGEVLFTHALCTSNGSARSAWSSGPDQDTVLGAGYPHAAAAATMHRTTFVPPITLH